MYLFFSEMHRLRSILAPFLAGSAVKCKRCSRIAVAEELRCKPQIPVFFIIEQITAVCPSEGMRRFCFCFRICRVCFHETLNSNCTDSSGVFPANRQQERRATVLVKLWKLCPCLFKKLFLSLQTCSVICK